MNNVIGIKFRVAPNDSTEVVLAEDYDYVVNRLNLEARLFKQSWEEVGRLRSILADLVGCVETAVRPGEWKFDGANDPDAILHRARKDLSE